MSLHPTPLNGCVVLTPTIFPDHRGYFYESYSKDDFNEVLGYEVNFVQDNESFSTKGTLRGLHFQKGNYAQAKLTRVVQGTVLDFAVEIFKQFGKTIEVKPIKTKDYPTAAKRPKYSVLETTKIENNFDCLRKKWYINLNHISQNKLI